jgi:hypothetical protein
MIYLNEGQELLDPEDLACQADATRQRIEEEWINHGRTGLGVVKSKQPTGI